jgi:hypothetical protein
MFLDERCPQEECDRYLEEEPPSIPEHGENQRKSSVITVIK